MNILSNDDTALNDVFALKCSETDIMEAVSKYKYQYNKIGDPQIVAEGVSQVATIISNMATKSKNMLASFASTSAKEIKLYLSDFSKFAEKHKKIFSNFPDSSIDFNIDGYVFSTVNVARINLEPVNRAITEYNTFLADLNKLIGDGDDPHSVKIQMNQYMSISNLSKIRAEMLGVDTGIDKDDFLSEVKKFYRSGSISKENIHVDKKYVMNIIDNIQRLQKELDKTLKESETVNSMFNTLMSYMKETINSLNKTGKLNVLTLNGGKVSKGNKVEISSDDARKIGMCMSLITSKYSQIIFLKETAEVILTERVSAIKDEIKQNSEILKICMMYSPICTADQAISPKKKPPVLSKHSSIPTESYTAPTMDSTDYLEITLEQLVLQESCYRDLLENRYLEEVNFVNSCLENGVILTELMEAGGMNTKYQSMKDSIIQFLDKIISAVRKKSVEYNKRYTQWLDDIGEESMVKKAQSMGSVTLAPYFDAENVDKDLSDIISAINAAVTNASKDNLSFTKTFIDGIQTQDDYDKIRGDLSGYLKNYFRFHKKNAKNVEKVEISGRDLASKVSNMVRYIHQYDRYTVALDKVKRAVDTAINRMGDGRAMESLLYLQIEERPTCESDLTLLEGYEYLLEAEEKSGTVTNEDGEPESATSVQTSEQRERQEAKEQGKTPVSSSKYAKTFQNFFQLAISAYVTAMEERYITYINVLCQLAGERPKVDANGKYIPKEKGSEKEEPSNESVLPQSFYDKPSEMKGISMYK